MAVKKDLKRVCGCALKEEVAGLWINSQGLWEAIPKEEARAIYPFPYLHLT